jgi:hypothetical protein
LQTEPPCTRIIFASDGASIVDGTYEAGDRKFHYAAGRHNGSISVEDGDCVFLDALYSVTWAPGGIHIRTIEYEKDLESRRYRDWGAILGFSAVGGPSESKWISTFPVHDPRVGAYVGSYVLRSDGSFTRPDLEWETVDWEFNGYQLGVQVKHDAEGRLYYRFKEPVLIS